MSPQEPDARYGQIIVITKSAETPRLVKALQSELRDVAPESFTMVKNYSRDSKSNQPVEARISVRTLQF